MVIWNSWDGIGDTVTGVERQFKPARFRVRIVEGVIPTGTTQDNMEEVYPFLVSIPTGQWTNWLARTGPKSK